MGTGGATTGTGGSATGTGGAATGTGGAAIGSGGATTGSGGTAAGTGGAIGTGGATTGSGGATGTGGGGTTGTGTGGRGTGGAATGTGGAGSGTGGRGTGGAATGGTGTGTGGAAAGGSSGAGGTVPTAAAIVPSLNGYLWVGACTAGSATGTDCPLNQTVTDSSCANASAAYAMRGTIRKTTHIVGGTTGTKYTLNLRVRGITGGRCYSGGTAGGPLSADVEGASGNNGWYDGGTQVGDSLWNTYEIHVTPPVPGKPVAADGSNVYFLNAFPSSSMYCERHETFIMKYDASFPVLGGGTITTTLHDSNCKGQQNCGGINSQASCTAPRTNSLADLPVQPTTAQATAAGLTSATQPFTQTLMSYHPQWLFITVPSVTSP